MSRLTVWQSFSNFFAEAVRQAREAAHPHPVSQVRAFYERRVDVRFVRRAADLRNVQTGDAPRRVARLG
jgi:hypothetical protein